MPVHVHESVQSSGRAQQSTFFELNAELLAMADVLYVTRVQKVGKPKLFLTAPVYFCM